MKRNERQSVGLSSQPHKHIVNRKELLVDVDGDIKRVVNKCANNPLPMRRYKGSDDGNLAGVKFGTFKVVGLYAFKRPGKKPLWVCQCKCGMYETRKSRSIHNPENANDRCHVCRQVLWVKQHKKYMEQQT